MRRIILDRGPIASASARVAAGRPEEQFLGQLAEKTTTVTIKEFTPEGGFATYVYRCLDASSNDVAYAETARAISRTMVALNFFREPLYAPQIEIDTGKFADYKLAVRKLPYLRIARQLFMGRAIHTSVEGWRSGLDKLLASSSSPAEPSEA